MKKLLFFSALLLNASLIHAEEVDLSELSCLNNPICKSCSQYAKFLFPIQEYSSELDAIEIEADHSEIIGKDTFHIIGNVQAKSDKYVLHTYFLFLHPVLYRFATQVHIGIGLE